MIVPEIHFTCRIGEGGSACMASMLVNPVAKFREHHASNTTYSETSVI